MKYQHPFLYGAILLYCRARGMRYAEARLMTEIAMVNMRVTRCSRAAAFAGVREKFKPVSLRRKHRSAYDMPRTGELRRVGWEGEELTGASHE